MIRIAVPETTHARLVARCKEGETIYAAINRLLDAGDAVNYPLLDALRDLTALYASSPGHDPIFVAKGLSAIAQAERRA